MQAMQDLSVLADQEGDRIMGACPPEKMTTLQLIQLFGRYARAHPGELHGNAAVAVFRALRKAYPCHSLGGDGPEYPRPLSYGLPMEGHKKQRYVYYHCTGYADKCRGEPAVCRRKYVREEVLGEVITS